MTPDELGEINETESPYCYVGSNPVSRIDPDGKNWWDIIAGVGTAIADNAYPGMNTAGSYSAASVSDFNAGQIIGQAASLFIGATEAVFGGGMMGGGGLSAILSGGSTTPVSIPLIAGGAIVAGQGLTMMSKATANLMTGNGQKQESNSTTKSTAGTRTKNRIPDTGEPNTTSTNKSGTTTKKYGPDGKVQKEFNNGHSGKNVPKNEKNNHVHDYKPNPQNPTGRG